MTGTRMSNRPEGRPLGEYDAALLSHLTARLATTLTATLHLSPLVAAELASQVRWTVETDDQGLWMTMTFPDGTYSAVGGEWPEETDSLLWYVDDVAYKLAGQGGAPCHDGSRPLVAQDSECEPVGMNDPDIYEDDGETIYVSMSAAASATVGIVGPVDDGLAGVREPLNSLDPHRGPQGMLGT